jgi:hypothetical protein
MIAAAARTFLRDGNLENLLGVVEIQQGKAAEADKQDGGKLAAYANDPAEVQVQYDLYRGTTDETVEAFEQDGVRALRV